MLWLAALLIALLAAQAWWAARERRGLLREIGFLADKIQAPERAQLYEPENPLSHVPLDDDEAFWRAKEQELNDG